MKWKKYKCLVDKYDLVGKDQCFLIRGESAKDMDGCNLNIETKFVEECSDPKGAQYEFEFLGEANDTPKDEEPEPKKQAKSSGLEKSQDEKYLMLIDNETTDLVDSLDKAKEIAENKAQQSAVIAKVVSQLSIKKITTWE